MFEESPGPALTVKENIDVAGFPTTAGTPRSFTPTADAAVVANLRSAGAQVVGKSAMDELGFGIAGVAGDGYPLPHPHAPGHLVGGSSGGTAIEVASGRADLGLGTDTGGSVRIPAAWCHLWGFRPTRGRYPSRGILELSPSRDTPGLLARDPQLLRWADTAITHTSSNREAPAGRVRIGLPEHMWASIDPEVEEACRAALHHVNGMELLPFTATWGPVHRVAETLLDYEIWPALQEYLTDVQTPAVKAYLSGVRDTPVPEETYRQAKEQQEQIAKAYAALFRRHHLDAIAFPTTPMSAPPVADQHLTTHAGQVQPLFPLATQNLQLASITGAPSLTIPVGKRARPVGLTIETLPGRDAWLLTNPKWPR